MGFGHSVSRFLFQLGFPLCDESDPVAPNEWVLRRIPTTANYFRPDLAYPFQRLCFAPNNGDVDGISVYREKFVSPRYLSRKTGRKPPYIVAKVRADAFSSLNLTLRAAPEQDPREPRGHVLVDEFTYANRQQTKDLQMKLSQLAVLAYMP